jgi:hypothetical protein
MPATDWDEVGVMIADCEQRSSKLNDWEAGFIDDIAKRFADRGSLPQGTLAKLTEIWEKVT